MTEQEAFELLKYHSYMHERVSHVKMEKGFLGMLRPFRGKLYEENFHELMTILKALRPRFKSETLDRQMIFFLWSICHMSRAWALERDGMLQQNNLIDEGLSDQLSTWVDCISVTVMNLLDDVGDEETFECYNCYLKDAEDE